MDACEIDMFNEEKQKPRILLTCRLHCFYTRFKIGVAQIDICSFVSILSPIQVFSPLLWWIINNLRGIMRRLLERCMMSYIMLWNTIKISSVKCIKIFMYELCCPTRFDLSMQVTCMWHTALHFIIYICEYIFSRMNYLRWALRTSNLTRVIFWRKKKKSSHRHLCLEDV